MESIIERNKEEYYLALRRTQASLREGAAEWGPWLLFFLRAVSRQAKSLEAKIEKERFLMAAVPELSLRILEHVKAHGRVRVGEMSKLTGVSRNTLKGHFQRLAADGRLVLRGEGRGAHYTLGAGEV
jgi:Fic family protein